ncbi:hypothetical protein CDL15_Pgr002791 [Punica granatum]|uniref:Uncharacterized protein n=1 Tax=Punica granatum TaxID=22663 RepID=A0A218X1U5_PUNGR|nr:hypothetical protein CDL15_Pgr002791 [Punica granatum]
MSLTLNLIDRLDLDVPELSSRWRVASFLHAQILLWLRRVISRKYIWKLVGQVKTMYRMGQVAYKRGSTRKHTLCWVQVA